MDDSVIKVLRRNGSWQETNKRKGSVDEPMLKNSKPKSFEDEFKLDEKFVKYSVVNLRGVTKKNQILKIKELILKFLKYIY